jgi:hypothetical protein
LPRLIVERPHDGTKESFVVWWHTRIRIEKRFWSSIDAIHNCKVYMVIGDWRVQLTWRTGIEVTETVTLQHGDDWRVVPLIIRKDTIGDMWVTAAPGRLREFRVDAFEPRITDTEAILHNRNLQTLRTVEHFVTIEVRSGQDVLRGSPLFLNIPKDEESNRSFTFR